ncbi:MAG: type II toxin-antitoxin system RelE/ParE family toxin [Actinomycetota bacterium]|nr:MAG: type II toxin-antitoxin system RelE/ParE family toxin [Actinomycetota bacterium]
MNILQSLLFQKQKKRLFKRQIKTLDLEIRKIIKNPLIGQEKKGTLRGVRVHKFHIGKQLFLLAYEVEANIMRLIMIGSHENYYRDLSKYYDK